MNDRKSFLARWNTLAKVDPSRVKNRCFYCGRLMRSGKGRQFDSPFMVSVEHILPKHKHVQFQNNTVKTCMGCNRAKSGAHLNEFREWMGGEFYCEKIMMMRFPVADGSRWGDLSLKFILAKMIDDWSIQCRADINKRFSSRSNLVLKLQHIGDVANGAVSE